eukprot:5076462-Karenia_brevis.AAC.1
MYKDTLEDVIKDIKWHEMTPNDQLAAMKTCMKQVGFYVRDMLLQLESDYHAKDSMLATISRCIFFQNKRLADFLIQRYPVARAHLMYKDGALILKNVAAFSNEVSKFRSKVLNGDIKKIQSEMSPKRPSCDGRRRQAHLTGLAKLWCNINRSRRITAISTQVLDDPVCSAVDGSSKEVILDDPADMIWAHKKQWEG